MYVDDTSQGGVIVLVYPPGATSPSRTIGIPHRGRAGGPGALAFDKNGNLLVATFEAESEVANVYRIARGSSKAKNLKLQGLTGGALGTDKNGNIYAGGDEGAIAVYQPGSTSPARYIDAGTSGFYSSFAVSPDGTVYWPNYDLGEMFEFAPGASAPTNVFEGGGVDAAVGPW